MAQNGRKLPFFAHQTLFSVLGVGLHGASRLIYAIVIARILGPTTLAFFTAALAITLVAALIWPTGSGVAAAHFVAETNDANQLAALIQLSRRSFLTVMVPISAIVAVYLAYLGVTPPLAIATAVLTFGYSAYVALRSVLLALNAAFQTAVYEGIAAMIALAGLFVVAQYELQDWVLAPVALAYIPFVVLGLNTVNRIIPKPSEPFKNRQSFITLSGWNSGSFFAANGLLQVSVLAVYIVANTGNQAAMFAAAVSIAGPTAMLAQAISQVLQPRVSSWWARDALYASVMFKRLSGWLVLAISAVFTIAFLITPWIIQILLGGQYGDAQTIFRVLLIGMCGFSIASIFAVGLISLRREHLVTFAYAAGVVVGGIAMWLLSLVTDISLAASIGVAAGYLVAACVIAVFETRQRKIKAAEVFSLGSI